MRLIFALALLFCALASNLASAQVTDVSEQARLVSLAKKSRFESSELSLKLLEASSIKNENVILTIVDLLHYVHYNNNSIQNESIQRKAAAILVNNLPYSVSVQSKLVEILESRLFPAGSLALEILEKQGVSNKFLRERLIKLLSYNKSGNLNEWNLVVRSRIQSLIDEQGPLSRSEYSMLAQFVGKNRYDASMKALGLLWSRAIPYSSIQSTLMESIAYSNISEGELYTTTIRDSVMKVFIVNKRFLGNSIQVQLIAKAKSSRYETADRILNIFESMDVLSEGVRSTLISMLKYSHYNNSDAHTRNIRQRAEALLAQKTFVSAGHPLYTALTRIDESRPLNDVEKKVIEEAAFETLKQSGVSFPTETCFDLTKHF